MRAGLIRLWSWLLRAPLGWRVALAGVATGGAVVAAILLYRTYDYVQHQNEFCLSCHLMEDPYRRFERSAHRGLACKACHRPTLLARGRMALRQVVEQPERVAEHEEVPNETCAECHIRGDPARWKLIANSAGHRVHLESEDPALRGLRCVECHATSIHEFTASDRTCGKGGCHEESRIRLGKMTDLTVHCAACHAFSRPVEVAASADTAPALPAPETPVAALTPRREECLSCHAMRVLLEGFPAAEPHGAVCGACHNPHQQATPREAVASCATSGCHARPDRLTPFHRGLRPGVLDRCTECHRAHGWKAEGDACQTCHRALTEPRPPRPAGDRPVPRLEGEGGAPQFSVPVHRAGSPGRLGLAGFPWPWRLASPLVAAILQQPAPPRSKPAQGGFSHARHRAVRCMACHAGRSDGVTHGALTVRTRGDCMGCHHAPENRGRCLSCHARTELAGQTERALAMKLTVWDTARTRPLPFRHEWHGRLACLDCHAAAALDAAPAACAACHLEHHAAVAGRSCSRCHTLAGKGAHPREVHLGCAGAGCHQDRMAAALPPARSVCLVCHQQAQDHYPARECAACHAVPRWDREGAP